MREMGHERGKGSHAPGQWSVDKSAKGGPLEGTVDAVVGSCLGRHEPLRRAWSRLKGCVARGLAGDWASARPAVPQALEQAWAEWNNGIRAGKA
jgi:hypothetical protein